MNLKSILEEKDVFLTREILVVHLSIVHKCLKSGKFIRFLNYTALMFRSLDVFRSCLVNKYMKCQ